jgi:hypothetical protein
MYSEREFFNGINSVEENKKGAAKRNLPHPFVYFIKR